MAKRTHEMKVWLTKEESDRIHEKMAEAGIQNQSAFVRKMVLDGICVKLDLGDVNELVRLLRITSNNLNQYAKRANETSSIYAADIADLQERQKQMWDAMREILVRLASIQ